VPALNPRFGAAALIALAAVTGLSGCSDKSSHAATTPTSAPPSVTVMMDRLTHSISSGVNCSSHTPETTTTPTESGDLTTRIDAHDDSASVQLALSDETPPSVDSFGLTLKSGSTQYEVPYQPTQNATQVQATKNGKSYTVTGSADALTPGQSGTRKVTFGIHVTCP
jgi:hypothetical protein